MTSRTTSRTSARNRRAYDPSVPKKANPAVIASIASTAADTIRITFQTRVLKSQLPKVIKAGAGGAETVDSVSQISATVVEFVFTGTVQGTNLIVEEGDPGVRTPAGGFVPAGTYAIPAFP